MKTHNTTPTAACLGVTDTQRRNIARLAVFVREYHRTPREGRRIATFAMGYWARARDGTALGFPSLHKCATAACFAGHGPAAGIDYEPAEGWLTYAYRQFTGREGGRRAFLFGAHHPDCPDAACRRAAYFLQHGMPDSFDPDRYKYKPSSVPDSFEPDWGFVEAVAEGRA